MVEGGAPLEVCAIRINGTIRSELSLTFLPISGGNATCNNTLQDPEILDLLC